MTWGAGGSSFDTTLDLCGHIIKYMGLDVLMHITCTGLTRERIVEALDRAKGYGIKNILALRGDPPSGVDNWVAVEGEMIAAKNGNEFPLHPQSRQFFKPPMQTSEAALLTRWNGQLYVVIAQPDQEGDGRWQVRLWWKPFVTFIWYGAILIALGGAIALLGRMGRRTKKPALNTWQTE
jgi:cytochrome c-type biogenesis protein CcmF